MSEPRVGVGLVVSDGSQLLLMRRGGEHEGGTWSSPGGHLDHGEDPAACAAREAREELGVEVSDVGFLAVTSDVFEDSGQHYLTVWFTGRTLRGSERVESANEVMEFGWFDLDRLPHPLFTPLQNLLDGRCVGQGGTDLFGNEVGAPGSIITRR